MNCCGRSIDGEVDVIADDITTTDLEVSGTATINNLFVSGITTIPGGVIDLTDIVAESLIVEGTTDLDTLTVVGTSNLASVNATAIQGTTITSSGNVNGVGANFSGLTANQIVATDASKNLVSKATTGTGSVVLATAPTISSLTLGTPLGVSSGGTGQTNLAAVTVGNATNAVNAVNATNATNASAAVTALNINAGGIGQLVTQTAVDTTGFTLPGASGTILTSNGASTMPTFQTPSVGAVSGVLPVLNGGTGVTTATGTGSVVRNTSPSLTTPVFLAPICDTMVSTSTTNATAALNGAIYTSGGISSVKDIWVGLKAIINSPTDATNTSDGALRSLGGASILKNIVAGGVIQSEIVQNASSTVTGALRAIAGGISCALDAWVGGRVFSQSTADGTSTISGAFQTPGGLSTVKGAFIGTAASAFTVVARSTVDVTTPFTGAMQSSGGLYVDRDSYVGQAVKAANFKLHAQAHNLNFDEGTFTPFMQGLTPAEDALIPAITYSQQDGYYQNCNQFTNIYIRVKWVIPSGMPGVSVSIGGIPGTYFEEQSLTFSNASVLNTVGVASENLQPYQLLYSPVDARWIAVGWRQALGNMVTSVKVYNGTAVGATQEITLNATLLRTTL